jgi:hypothetical protein
MIRIDVHPAGENPTNTTRTLPTLVHVRPVYASCGWSPYVTTFHGTPTYLDRSHCSRKKGLPTQSTTRQLTDPRAVPSFSLEPANEAGGVSQAHDGDQLLDLSGPYHRHAIGIFNTCSRGPTEGSLIDTGGGYNLRGAGLPHTTPQPSRPAVSTFP